MADQLEETSFDYIVLGTGLVESILAGSLARAGKKVLHLDSHQNYGGNWSVFGFRELAQWYLSRKNTVEPKEGDISINYEQSYQSNFRNVELDLLGTEIDDSELEQIRSSLQDGTYKDHMPAPALASDKAIIDSFFDELTTENFERQLPQMKLFVDLLRQSRSYNLDTTPKLLSTREELVETLIQSGVGRYLEFKNVDDIFVFDKTAQALEKVPSSKEDVFTNKSVTLIEKRKLMKFLTFSMDWKEDDSMLEGTENMTYSQFLQEKFKITGKLQVAIVYAIALADNQASVKVGLESTQRFVQSMGRFGKGAYLCPLYGGGSEIAQAFCRVCAVYGGIYILNQPLDKFVVDEKGDCTGVVTEEGREYTCSKLISGIDYLNASWLPSSESFGAWVSRAILVTDVQLGSAEDTSSEALSYSVFPPENDTQQPIYAIHQNEESMACPRGQYVTYLWSLADDDSAVKKAAQLLIEAKNAKLLFSVYYQQRTRSISDQPDNWKLPNNIVACSDPDTSMNFESAFQEARTLFYQCESSDTEFMPAAEAEQEEEYY